MELFSTYEGYSKGYNQKRKKEENRWRVETEIKQGETGEDESQPLINLGLGIGGSTSTSFRVYDREKDKSFDRVMKVEVKQEKHDDDHEYDQVVESVGCRKCSVVRFTEDQKEEFKRQLLIFKYMVWGLPVPFQLLLPIWRTFSSSSVPPHFYLYTTSPPFLLSYFRGGFNHMQMTDPEPGRCRRTDGKKWRCHQFAILNEKYCEKHMHRGRKRSRKLVEAPPYPKTPNLINLNRNDYPIRDDIRATFLGNPVQNGPTRGVLRGPGLINSTAKSKNHEQNNEAKRNIVVNQKIAVFNQASGLDFSPKSVLQNDMGVKCARVESCKNSPESSKSRCKRTDGKKWQCKKEVIPDRKYCAQHINRGKNRSGSAKPFTGSSASGSKSQSAARSSTSNTYFSGTDHATGGLGLDTNLKISLPTNLAPNGSSTSTSSSEATESDEGTDVSDIIVLSP